MNAKYLALLLLGLLALAFAQDASAVSDDSSNVASLADDDSDDSDNSVPEDAALATSSSAEDDDDEDDDEDDDDESDNATTGDVLTSTVDSSPCGCKGRVKNPGDEFPFDVQCQCEIEKPDFGRLPVIIFSLFFAEMIRGTWRSV